LDELLGRIDDDRSGNRKEVEARFHHAFFRYFRAARKGNLDKEIQTRVRSKLIELADALDLSVAKELAALDANRALDVSALNSVWEETALGNGNNEKSDEEEDALLQSSTPILSGALSKRDQELLKLVRNEEAQQIKALKQEMANLRAKMQEKEEKKDQQGKIEFPQNMPGMPYSWNYMGFPMPMPPPGYPPLMPNYGNQFLPNGNQNNSQVGNVSKPEKTSDRNNRTSNSRAERSTTTEEVVNNSSRSNSPTGKGNKTGSDVLRRPVNLSMDWNIRYSEEGKGMDLESFLTMLKIYADADGVTEEQLFKCGAKFLEGKALKDYVHWGKYAKNWEQFVDKLRIASGVKVKRTSIIDQIRTTVQGPKEAYMVFRSRIDGLCEKIDPPIPEEELLEYVMGNLRRDIARLLITAKVHTMEDLDRAVGEIEPGLERYNKRHDKPTERVGKLGKGTNNQVYHVGLSHEIDSEDDDLEESLEVMEAYVHQKGRDRKKSFRDPYCGICQEKGHWVSQCKYNVRTMAGEEEMKGVLRNKFPELYEAGEPREPKEEKKGQENNNYFPQAGPQNKRK
jgi:hypothetical protein